MTKKRIGTIIIGFGILGIILEIFSELFIYACFGPDTSALMYMIYGVIVFIGYKIKKNVF